MPQIQHSHFNLPCKYTEMNARCQIFFADLSRFSSILIDTSILRQSFPHYGRACNCTAKRAGSSRSTQPPPELVYKHSDHWDRMPPADRWAAGRSRDWRRSSAHRGPDPSRLRGGSWHFQAETSKKNAPEACWRSGALAVFYGWGWVRNPSCHL